MEWVFYGYSFSFGWYSSGFGDGQWVGFRSLGEEPNPVYAATISHQIFALYQMMFAVRNYKNNFSRFFLFLIFFPNSKIITPAIMAGAVVERMTFLSWCVFVWFWATIVYNPLGSLIYFIFFVIIPYLFIFYFLFQRIGSGQPPQTLGLSNLVSWEIWAR